jgi:hypothetical protein
VSTGQTPQKRGFWPIRTYRDYIEKHTTIRERRELTDPNGQTWNDDYPNIVIANTSMQRWMSDNNIVSLNDRDMNFRNLRAIYRLETARHIAGVKGWLEQIKRWRTGLALLAEIASRDEQECRIVPYRDGKLNAYEWGRDDVAETAKGVPVDYSLPPGESKIGTGDGSDAVIEFSQETWRGEAMRPPSDAPDEVLFHELVHASRTMRGVADKKTINRGYGDQEEYIAVLLTNIYMSEKGQLTFAGSHGSRILKGLELEFFLDNSQHVNMSPMQLLDNFRWAQPQFYNAIANLPPPRPKYNWVRMHRDRRKHQQVF